MAANWPAAPNVNEPTCCSQMELNTEGQAARKYCMEITCPPHPPCVSCHRHAMASPRDSPDVYTSCNSLPYHMNHHYTCAGEAHMYELRVTRANSAPPLRHATRAKHIPLLSACKRISLVNPIPTFRDWLMSAIAHKELGRCGLEWTSRLRMYTRGRSLKRHK